MTSKWRFLLGRFNRQLWARAALYCLVGVGTALLAALLGPLLPVSLGDRIGADAVKELLTIMASSMLAVATFSLSTMVSAFAAASSSTTPRAATLLIEDTSAQRALSTFIGAFLFSIVGLVALDLGVYGVSGRLVLFGATIIMITIVVATLLDWIDHLGRFGRVGTTIDRVEEATRASLATLAVRPLLGGAAAVDVPEQATALKASKIGYIRYIDVGRLNAIAETADLQIHLHLLPGAFTDPVRSLALLVGEVNDECHAALLEAFVIGDSRTFEQDPRFGFIVLAEIASRALSPAINDPGTAIDVIGTAVRLLCGYREQRIREADAELPRVHVPKLSTDDLFDDLFTPIARDGAAFVEVGQRLQRAFTALMSATDEDFSHAALRHRELALQRAQHALSLAEDYEILKRVAGSAPPK